MPLCEENSDDVWGASATTAIGVEGFRTWVSWRTVRLLLLQHQQRSLRPQPHHHRRLHRPRLRLRMTLLPRPCRRSSSTSPPLSKASFRLRIVTMNCWRG